MAYRVGLATLLARRARSRNRRAHSARQKSSQYIDARCWDPFSLSRSRLSTCTRTWASTCPLWADFLKGQTEPEKLDPPVPPCSCPVWCRAGSNRHEAFTEYCTSAYINLSTLLRPAARLRSCKPSIPRGAPEENVASSALTCCEHVATPDRGASHSDGAKRLWADSSPKVISDSNLSPARSTNQSTYLRVRASRVVSIQHFLRPFQNDELYRKLCPVLLYAGGTPCRLFQVADLKRDIPVHLFHGLAIGMSHPFAQGPLTSLSGYSQRHQVGVPDGIRFCLGTRLPVLLLASKRPAPCSQKPTRRPPLRWRSSPPRSSRASVLRVPRVGSPVNSRGYSCAAAAGLAEGRALLGLANPVSRAQSEVLAGKNKEQRRSRAATVQPESASPRSTVAAPPRRSHQPGADFWSDGDT